MVIRTVQGRTFTLRRPVARAGLAIFVSLFCELAGATVIETVVDADHQACSQLLSMVKAAGIPSMSDKQLCDFRFANLPPSKTSGFSFPQWVEFEVADGPAMYFHLLEANVPPKAVSTRGYPWPQLTSGARHAAAEKNLVFSKVDLKIAGKGESVAFVQMDVKRCSAQPYMKHMAFPYYAVFRDEGLQHPWPVSSNLADPKQIALWKGNIPVEISIENGWIDAKNGSPLMLIVAMQGIAETEVDGPFYGALNNYPVCQFNLTKARAEIGMRRDKQSSGT